MGVTLKSLTCPECGEMRINTGQGYSVCPRGHGRLHPPVFASVLHQARRDAWLDSIPLATPVMVSVPYLRRKEGRLQKRAYMIEGREGYWVPMANERHVRPMAVVGAGTCARVCIAGQVHVWRFERSERLKEAVREFPSEEARR